jgi:amidophosphoribosyltransferase
MELWHENQVRGDIVIPVPDSSVPAAIGFAQASGIPYSDGFIKNRYIGRTFIQPSDTLRKQGVALKFNVLVDNVRGKRVIMIDDSIVRGNTSTSLVRMVKEAGALEVHLAITCPPIAHPCFMGVDMGCHDELIAHRMNNDEMCRHIGCDSLYFLSLLGLMKALGRSNGYCNACFTGHYPISIDKNHTKTGFE